MSLLSRIVEQAIDTGLDRGESPEEVAAKILQEAGSDREELLAALDELPQILEVYLN